MAFSSTNYFTTIGKFIKHVNVWNGYLTALDTAKSDVSTVLNTYSLLDYFVPVPAQIDAFQAQVSGWIQQYIADVEAITLDETIVISQLPIISKDIQTVLDAIIDYMTANAVHVTASVVTLGGSDVDIKKFKLTPGGAGNGLEGNVFVSRILDGINAPSNRAAAKDSYLELESMLATSCTIYGKCLSSNPGQEVVQLFSELDSNNPYDDESEKPGTGPTLTNIESLNLVPSNYDFTNWSADNPVDWTLTGGVSGTDWEDLSSSGEGPLRISTVGTYAKQKIGSLQRRRQYFFGAIFNNIGSTGSATMKFRVENSDGSTVHKNFTSVTNADVTTDTFGYIYGFYAPDDSVNLDDIYVVFEYDAESNAGSSVDLYKVAISPVQFFNGLGFVFWNPLVVNPSTVYDLGVLTTSVDTAGDPPETQQDWYGSIAIANNNAGVIQTFYRKAFGVQLPVDGSPSLSDSLAT